MDVVHTCLTLITACAVGYAAWLSLNRHRIPLDAARQVRVPETWVIPMGCVLGLGAVGLLAGLVEPMVGLAAATGLTIYFLLALLSHLRVGDRHLAPASSFLLLTAVNAVFTLLAG